MPVFDLNDQEKDYILRKKGLDPTKFDINNDTGGIVYRVKESPTVEPPEQTPLEAPTPTRPRNSFLGALSKGAASGVLPTFGGAGGASGLARLGLQLPGPPIVKGIGALAGGVAGAIGGSTLTDYIQNKILPTGIVENLTQAEQEQPLGYNIGRFASSLAAFKPDPMALFQAGKTGLKLLSNVLPGRIATETLKAGEIANLANIGTGAGLGAAIPVASSIASGQPINPGEVVASALGNALISNPNILSQKLLKLTPNVRVKSTKDLIKQTGLETSTLPPNRTLADYDQTQQGIEARESIKRGELPEGYKVERKLVSPPPLANIEENILSPAIRKPKLDKYGFPLVDKVTGQIIYKRTLPESGTRLRTLGEKQDVVVPYKSAEESAEAILRENDPTVSAYGRGRVREEGEQELGKFAEEYKVKEAKREAQYQEYVKKQEGNRESNYQLFKNLVSQGKLAEAEKFAKDLEEGYYFRSRYSREKLSGTKEEFPPQEPGKLTAEQQRLLAERRKLYQTIGEKQGEEVSGLTLPAKTRLMKKVEKAGTTEKLRTTKSFYDIFSRVFGEKRNVRVTTNRKLVETDGQGNPIIDSATGKPKPVRGATDAIRKPLQERLIEINPTNATPDTLPHEFVEGFLKDLEESPDANDKRVVSELFRSIENSEEYQKAKTEFEAAGFTHLTPREFIAETTGYEVFNRAVNLDKRTGTLRQSFTDFVGRLKAKWGRAKPEDWNNFIAKRFLEDPDFIDTHITPRYGSVNIKVEDEDVNDATVKPKISIEKLNQPEETGGLVEQTTKESELENARIKSNNRVEESNEQRSEQLQDRTKESKGSEVKSSEEEKVLSKAEDFEDIQNKTKSILASKAQQDLLDDYKFSFEDRTIFQNIKVGSNKVRSKFAGVYYPTEKESHARPNDVATALHESVHAVNDRHKNELVEHIKTLKFEPDELRAVGKSLSNQGDSYDWINARLRKIADGSAYPALTTNPDNIKKFTAEDIYHAFDEASAQFSDRRSPTGDDLVFENFVKKVAGDDVRNFLMTESKQEKYYPKFEEGAKELKETYIQKRNELRLKSRELFKQEEDLEIKYGVSHNLQNDDPSLPQEIKNLRSKRLQVYDKIDNLDKELDKIRKKHRGRYYQPSSVQGLDTTKIRETINKVNTSPEFRKEGVINKNLREISSRIPIFGPELDKFEIRNGPSGRQLAPAIREALAQATSFEGRWLNPSLETLETLPYKDQLLVTDTMLKEKRLEQSFREELPSEETKIVYDRLRDLLLDKQENQIEANQPVMEFIQGKRGGFEMVPRLPKINPYYFPEVVGSKQLDILLNAEGSEAFNILKKDFITHIKEKYRLSDSDASKFFEEVKASYGGPLPGNINRFGAVRKAEGIGLPDSWLETDPRVALRRYWRRTAKDRAWFDAVEKDTDNLYILGFNKDAWGDDIIPSNDNIARISAAAKPILDIINGANIQVTPRIDAMSRIANNLILGPVTGINDLISALPVVSKFSPNLASLPGIYLSAIKNIGQGIKDARATGRIKKNISDVEETFFPGTELVEKLRQTADGISKITGRAALENVSRGLTMAAGSEIIRLHKTFAEAGNKKSVDFLTKIANNKDYTKLSDNDLAARIVDLAQGTYDLRGLPAWVLNSPLAPIFRLSKWNIEQLNNLHKFAIQPATKGDFGPLIVTLLGGAVGGYVSKEIRELINQKKSNIPNFKEISNADPKEKVPASAYSLAAAISYSGVLGLLGEGVKSGFDINYKNKPQGFNYPLVEMTVETTDNIAKVIQAISAGEDITDVGVEFAKNQFGRNIQVGRLAATYLGNKDVARKSEERRDLRVYNQLHGQPFSPQTLTSGLNPYENLDKKRFYKASDRKEIIGESRRLVKEVLEENKGDAEGIRRGLRNLKTGGAATTLPSPESNPIAFNKYIKYLKATYGEEEANRRIKSYMKERALGSFKRSLIPSI